MTEEFANADVRYSTRRLPAYRYVPGKSMHRVVHPTRHGYSTSAVGSDADDSAETEPGAVFRYGVDLHNAGFWWEAHEAWEFVWLSTMPNSAPRHGLRGMIQVANCHFKVQFGRHNVVKRLRADFTRCFDAALLHTPGLVVFGFVLAPWICAVADYYSPSVERTSHDPDRFPFIVLEGQELI